MEKELFILNRNGDKLSAVLHKPKNETKSIVLVSSSFKGDKDYQPIIKKFCEKACEEGIAALRYDYYGSGESEGKYEESTVNTHIHDLLDVIEFVRNLDYEKISLAGLSLGTTISWMVTDDHIRSLILWSPPFNLKWLYERYISNFENNNYILIKRQFDDKVMKISKKFIEQCKDLDMKDIIKKSKAPALVVYGTEDHGIKLETIKEYYEMINSEKELLVIEGGDHNYMKEDAREKCMQKSIDWLKKYGQ